MRQWGIEPQKNMRQPGIEPGAKQWECSILPLNHWRAEKSNKIVFIKIHFESKI
jgi:hypothetical protein